MEEKKKNLSKQDETKEKNLETKNETTDAKIEKNTKIEKDTKIEKEEQKVETKKKHGKIRKSLVLLFLVAFAIVMYVVLRGSYLEFQELGENFIPVFYTNLTYKIAIMGINFVILYLVMYFTNRGIKKGLKIFFDKEKKEIPKLPNKSLALVISAIVSVIVGILFTDKILLVLSNSAFGIQDPIFNLDIAYYMIQKPVIEMILIYVIALLVGISAYTAIYYVIVFNNHFEGIDGKMLKQSNLLKKIKRNIKIIAVAIALLTVIGTQNILFGEITKLKEEDISITGAGNTEATIKLYGYLIFAIVIVISAFKAVKAFSNGTFKETIKKLIAIPVYLVVLFVVMVSYDLIFVKTNELDKEKQYLEYNIKNTKDAYNISIEEENVENSGTITKSEIEQNKNTIDNITIISKDSLMETLEDSQTGTGYYSYKNATIGQYKINGKQNLLYVAPREMASSGRTYNNKTYENTHGMGLIMASATSATQNGTINYIQKEVSGEDNVIKVNQPRMYFGLETNSSVATSTKNKKEYDYTDKDGNDYTSVYEGKAGLKLNFLDKLILGITKGDLNLAFSGEMTEDSKILINRNVVDRAKKALPNLIYDANPYTVVTDDGRIVWVIDAYTVSSNYPYSQYTSIEHDNVKQKINYIRNSVKVIVDAYDGTMSYYITDRTDPIAMGYRNVYPTLFKNLDEQIPSDIASHIIYPEYLYKIQSNMLSIYHNVKPDVLYRSDDLWEIAKTNTTSSTKSTGTTMNPYYTMVKTNNENEGLGLVQIYTQAEKQSLISYLVGKTDGTENKLKLYKFPADSNIVGPMQLDKQIAEDEAISTELQALSTTGAKVTKQMLIVPLNNTLLYVEPVYQTMLNESEVPVLKKVVVASGNKVAIGDNLTSALENLVSQYAVDIEVENTDDIAGVMEEIIKANKNLKESNSNNDWEMMGKDVKKLQDLISRLEQLKEEEEKKAKEKGIEIPADEKTNTTNTTENQIFVNESNE